MGSGPQIDAVTELSTASSGFGRGDGGLGVAHRFVVEGHDVEACVGQLLEELLGSVHHEVAVQGALCVGPQ